MEEPLKHKKWRKAPHSPYFWRSQKLIVYRPSTEKVIDMLTFTDQKELPNNSNTTPH